LIYDWIRGWIKAVTMQSNGDFDKMEPFFPSLKVNSLIDMEVGPDGKLYLLEYGNGWFSKNPDAGLARIDYNAGNRPPAITALKVDRSTGILPFTIKATVEAKDPEKDKITYIWNFGNGETKQTTVPEVEYTFKAPGDYKISVDAKDSQGASAKSDIVSVYAGNEAPSVAVELTGGNKSFYLPGVPLQYAVKVTDKNDTSKMDPANLYVSVDYLEGVGKAAASVGHQQGQATIGGKIKMLSLDCKSCHKEAEKSIGPSFQMVSQKYFKDPNAMNYLTQKIIKGGSGVWGDVAMSAHPTLAKEDVQQIVSWVLSLSDKSAVKKSLPPTGTIIPPANQKPNSTLVLTASYKDKGGNNIKALTGTSSASLPGSMIEFTGNEKVKGFTKYKYGNNSILLFPAEGWFALDSIDLTSVRSASVNCGWKETPESGISIEARLDAPDGQLLGKGTMPAPAKGKQSGVVKIPFEKVADGRFHTVYFLYKAQEPISGRVSSVQFNTK